MRYVAYIRKSTEQAERQSLSIPAQKRKIRELFPHIRIVKWIEESKSAFTPGRKGFAEMVELLNSGKADGIVSWHPDRLSRCEIDAAYITYGLRRGVIKDLKFGSYFFDNSPEGIMMLQNIMSNSQYYSAKLSKDVKRGNDEQRKRGWLTGRSIEGYLNERSKDGMSYGIIVIDPDRFTLRRKMWDLMLTGNYSTYQIRDIANNQWGYKTRGNRITPSGPLSRSAIYAMFNNPRYAGLIPVPGKADTYEKASYKPMVSEEEYNRVQELLNRKGTRKLATRKVFTFRGTMTCGECGCMITAEDTMRYYKNGTTQKFTYYHCTHQRPCTQRKNTREESLEQQFNELLIKRKILPQFKDWALETLDSQNDVESVNIAVVLASQNRTIEATHREMKKLISMAAKELISEDQFKNEQNDLDDRIKILEKELKRTKEQAENWYVTFTKAFEVAIDGVERFNNGSVNVKKEILENIGQNPVLLDGRLQIDTFPWLVLIENEYPKLEVAYKKVRTLPDKIQEQAMETVRSSWLGMRYSNPH
ncbi:MAG TPA: recombinase family protein [Candidatus Dormibacteraeota bacterium]|nr:recombinase family protein [Candidatus Dormibacteraeota bacterium]